MILTQGEPVELRRILGMLITNVSSTDGFLGDEVLFTKVKYVEVSHI